MKGMNRHLAWLILALSLLFNVFFVVGFMQARAQLARVESQNGASRLVADELNLDDEQAAVFGRLRSGLREEMADYRQEIALVQAELVAELANENPDLDRVRALVARKSDLHRQRRLAGSQRFQEFLGLLSPEQCRRLSRRMHHGPPGGPRQRHMLKRFDANADGVLDEEERAAAEAFIEGRRQERRRRHAEARQGFDTDGDGRLDPQEEEAFREWMRERRRSRPRDQQQPSRF